MISWSLFTRMFLSLHRSGLPGRAGNGARSFRGARSHRRSQRRPRRRMGERPNRTWRGSGRPTHDVDSVDELLFMVPRQLVMSEPLTESPDMAWHAYAVEYGLRVRKLGLRVGVAHIPVTHNSLTKNLARLDVAHARVAARYRDMLPIHTTCGVLTRKMVNGRRSWLASLSYRYRRMPPPWPLRGGFIGTVMLRSFTRTSGPRSMNLSVKLLASEYTLLIIRPASALLTMAAFLN